MRRSVVNAIAALLLMVCALPLHAAIVAGNATSAASNGNVSSLSLARPAGIVAGDLQFIQVNSNSALGASLSASGWTQLLDDTSTVLLVALRQQVFYRVATAADVSGSAVTLNFGALASVSATASFTVYRSDLGRSLVLGATLSNTGGSTSLAGGSMTATAPGRLLRFFGHRAAVTLGVGSTGLAAHATAVATGSSAGAALLASSKAVAGSGTVAADTVTASTSARWVVQSVLLTESQPSKPTNCYTDTFDTLSNWVTTSRGTTAFTPAVVANRLRLTSNAGYISTAASLQRVFPTSNLIYIEFTYYGYPNGSGADGIAITLSDSNVTPQPGGFGGSLGYAPRDGTISGFAGGWVGIALDEYGNFSNPNEGRSGGPGFRADAVAIRGSGSGQSGYAYVTGTAAGLNPGVDAATANVNTAGPGHRYRIVIDAAGSGQTYITVDRDTTGAGNSYSNLIPTFNLEAASGQATIPSNLTLSFTGSTGGSTNIHEIDNLSVCATSIQAVNQVDHFEFQYPAQGLTCEPANVTVVACANAACTAQVPNTTVTLTPNSGWTGGNTVTLTNGSATVPLRQTTAGTAALSVASSTPGAKPFSQYKCNGAQVAANATCGLPFADAGLSFDVPNVIANRPSGAVRLRAVRNAGDAANSCVALFANTTSNINFWSTYTTPSTGTRSVELSAQPGSNNFTAIGRTSATATAIPLVFNAAGETTFEARYNDAGLMMLNAQYIGTDSNAGLVMSGSDPFVSKPAGLCVAATPTPATCTSNFNNCAAYVAAGLPFRLDVTAASWVSDTDSNFCANIANRTTPNYTQSMPLVSQLIAPSGGNAGAFGSYGGAFNPASITVTNGTVALGDATQSEVGVFNFVATPAISGYFGETVTGGTSANVGRFVPYRFNVASTANIRNGVGAWACPFTYQGQPFGFDSDGTTSYAPLITVTALNARNAVTRNYDTGGSGSNDDNSFWKFAPTLAHSYAHLAPPIAGGTLATLSQPPGYTVVPIIGTLNNNDGARQYRIDGESFLYSRSATPNAPFNANLQLTLNQAALISEAFLDPNNIASPDQACFRNGCGTDNTVCTSACSAFVSDAITSRSGQPAVEIRYGRLRLDSVSGPADQPLAVPVTAEYFDGTRFVTNASDNCTPIAGTGAQQSGWTDNLSSGKTTATGSATLANGTSMTALIMTPPGIGNEGSADLLLNLSTTSNALPWLQFDWNGDGSITAGEGPNATVSFGTYRGSDRVIFWQETN